MIRLLIPANLDGEVKPAGTIVGSLSPEMEAKWIKAGSGEAIMPAVEKPEEEEQEAQEIDKTAATATALNAVLGGTAPADDRSTDGGADSGAADGGQAEAQKPQDSPSGDGAGESTADASADGVAAGDEKLVNQPIGRPGRRAKADEPN